MNEIERLIKEKSISSDSYESMKRIEKRGRKRKTVSPRKKRRKWK